MFRWMLMVSTAMLASAASATMFWPIPTIFELSRSQRRPLESVACRPLGVGLQSATGIDFDDDLREYDATARCARHATIYGHPVFFERDCTYEGGWRCDAEVETMLAEFPDRLVLITAEHVPLTEAYWIVSHFVVGPLFEPAKVIDVVEGIASPPEDICRVKAAEGNELDLKCHVTERRVERVRSGGAVRYRQVPLPRCATTDNPACVAEP